MEIVEIKSIITKWDITGAGDDVPVKNSEKVGFLLGRNSGDFGNCIVTAIIQLTIETTFIFDIEVESLLQFKTKQTPTEKDIYELYKQARLKWNYEILIKSRDEGINPMIIRNDEQFIPFSVLQNDIKKAIAQTNIQNN